MNETVLQNEINQGRAELKNLWDAVPVKKLADGSEAKDMTAAQLEEFKKRNDELNEKGAALDVLRQSVAHIEALNEGEKASNRPLSNRAGGPVTAKSIADLYDEQKTGLPTFHRGKHNDLDLKGVDFDQVKEWLGFEAKTTMTTAAGYAPFVTREGGWTPAISRPPQLIDFIRVDPTSQNSIKFMQQTTRTNAAAKKNQNAALDESAIAFTEQTCSIIKIGTFIPVTEEQLEDATEVRAIVENDLRLMVRQELDREVTVGSNITGYTQVSGILTEAKASGDSTFDTVMKAIANASLNGRVNPNLVVLHTTDFTNMALTKTADGVYLYGSPSDAPLSRVWGLSCVKSDALTVTDGLVLDTMYSALKLRKDVTIAVSDSHSDYFIYNKLAIRAHCRAGLMVRRAESIVKMTGL